MNIHELLDDYEKNNVTDFIEFNKAIRRMVFPRPMQHSAKQDLLGIILGEIPASERPKIYKNGGDENNVSCDSMMKSVSDGFWRETCDTITEDNMWQLKCVEEQKRTLFGFLHSELQPVLQRTGIKLSDVDSIKPTSQEIASLNEKISDLENENEHLKSQLESLQEIPNIRSKTSHLKLIGGLILVNYAPDVYVKKSRVIGLSRVVADFELKGVELDSEVISSLIKDAAEHVKLSE